MPTNRAGAAPRNRHSPPPLFSVITPTATFFNLNDGFFFNKFKTHFTSLNYYSMPVSILFIVRKRLNFVFTLLLVLAITLFSLF